MNINHLHEFVVLVESENYIDAAEKLYISQSTLTKHIQSLERELGVSLIARTTRSAELTNYGELFLTYAKRITQLNNEFLREIKRVSENNYATLSVGTIPSMAQYNITDVVYSFKKDQLPFNLDIIEDDTVVLQKMLDDGIIELAFLRTCDDIDQYHSMLFARDSLVAVVPVSHPLASEESIRFSRLRNEDIASFGKSTLFYDLICKQCRKSGFEPSPLFEGKNIDSVADFAIKGMAIAIMTNGQTRFIRNPAVRVVDLFPTELFDVYLCWKRGQQLSPAAMHFIRVAGKALRKKGAVPVTSPDAEGIFINHSDSE